MDESRPSQKGGDLSPSSFDPDGAAEGDGLFGLPNTIEDARVVALPLPFEATVSYRRGTASAPAAIRRASGQVDLWDFETGSPWEAGIAMAAIDPLITRLNDTACRDAARSRVGGDGGNAARERVDDAGASLNELVDEWTTSQLETQRIPAVVGGDHAVALGAMRAAVRCYPGLGFLQIDAHADLRESYEGLMWSHASIIHNLLNQPGPGPVVQVGVRDQCDFERRRASEDPRIHQWLDPVLAAALATGMTWQTLIEQILKPLPERVWITFDVDGLDPALCPGTGTPVPGGLSWREATVLLATLGRSGRKIVGFDLCEVGCGEWDAIVGARLLYKMAGWAIVTATG